MTIQWFPGHMTKARRQIQDKLKLIDIAIELLMHVFRISSRNPMIEEILDGKPRLILFNKSDLADPRTTERWMAYFADQGHASIAIDSSTGTRVNEISVKVKELLHEKMTGRSPKE